ncbi:phosphoglycolate phosphatase [Bordetella genomosp. 1]|uniref:Phosphoglycolate phosphatase n=1 Tax=Bordetella genomosp. 1 TaxID=1395607 RepID=A0A261RW76_9BORD|nr:phosphoglycolate phosphatase [Bordetella genomosp. 1]OZI29318.1 phosphoglycolate phosphatase [Bordetella genomosp. 1]
MAFDLDGTLVESAPDLVAAVNAALAPDGLRPLEYEEARPYISRGARWLLEHALTLAGVADPAGEAAARFGRFLAHYGAHVADESRPHPGAIDALARLQAAGARLVVCTNKPTGLSRELLARLGMDSFFAAVVGIDAVRAAKPDPAHLIEAVGAVGGDLARTIMVGDAEPDAGAARAAGVPLILVDFGYTEIPAAELAPDVLLHHFDALVPACLALLEGASR